MKTGRKVEYVGATDAQVNWGGNDDPRTVLVEGSLYDIADVEVHSWHTKVRLEGIEGWFNSVSFREVEE